MASSRDSHILIMVEDNCRFISHLFNMMHQNRIMSPIEYKYHMEVKNDGKTPGWTVEAQVRVGGKTYETPLRTYKVYVQELQNSKSDAKRKALLKLASKLPTFCKNTGAKLSHKGKPLYLFGDSGKLEPCF